MTKEEILNMEAGPEIDALFAELVVEWRQTWRRKYAGRIYVWAIKGSKEYHHWVGLFKPSINISHAMEGVEKLADDNHVLELMWIPRYLPEQRPFWNFMIRENTKPGHREREEPTRQISVIGETKELAITRALILWAMEKETTDVREIPTEQKSHT